MMALYNPFLVHKLPEKDGHESGIGGLIIGITVQLYIREIKGENLLYSLFFDNHIMCVCGVCMWSNEIAWLTIYS